MADLESRAGIEMPELEEGGRIVSVRLRPCHFLPPSIASGIDRIEARWEMIPPLLDGSGDELTHREIHNHLGLGESNRHLRKVLEELTNRDLEISPDRGQSGCWKPTQRIV